MTDFNSGQAAKALIDGRLAQRPSEAKQYQPTLPKDFKLPEGYEVPKWEKDDPVLQAAQEFAHEANLTQDEFSKMVAVQTKADLLRETRSKEYQTTEIAKLGEKATARIDAIKSYMKASFGEKLANAIIDGTAFHSAEILGPDGGWEAVMKRATGGSNGFSQTHRNTEGAGSDADVKQRWTSMSKNEKLQYAREKEAREFAQRSAAR